MAAHSALARITDIVLAIELVRDELTGVTLAAFAADVRKRWLVERGIEIISGASRHLPPEVKARHPAIPWAQVAGIGNVLRHGYERVAYDILWHVVHDDLPELYAAGLAELARARAENGRRP